MPACRACVCIFHVLGRAPIQRTVFLFVELLPSLHLFTACRGHFKNLVYMRQWCGICDDGNHLSCTCSSGFSRTSSNSRSASSSSDLRSIRGPARTSAKTPFSSDQRRCSRKGSCYWTRGQVGEIVQETAAGERGHDIRQHSHVEPAAAEISAAPRGDIHGAFGQLQHQLQRTRTLRGAQSRGDLELASVQLCGSITDHCDTFSYGKFLWRERQLKSLRARTASCAFGNEVPIFRIRLSRLQTVRRGGNINPLQMRGRKEE